MGIERPGKTFEAGALRGILHSMEIDSITEES